MALEHGHSPREVTERLDAHTDSTPLRDAVFGGIDGTVTTFAIVAGVQGAGLAPGIIVALGLANVLADGFSMAAGNYSGTKAVADDRSRRWDVEKKHIRTNREGELEELDQILARKGLSGEVRKNAVKMISDDEDQWISLMLAEEYGLPATNPRPLRAALVIFIAFVAAGMFPILPFILGLSSAFGWSIAISGLTFFGIGAIKSSWSLTRWWRSGFETLLIGGTAATLAFVVGRLVHP